MKSKLETTAEIIKGIQNHPDVAKDVLWYYKKQLLDQVNKILIDEVWGYEGCAQAIDKINELRKTK